MAAVAAHANRQLALAETVQLHDLVVEGEKQRQAAVVRRTIDYVGPTIKYLQTLGSCTGSSVRGAALQPTAISALDLQAPHAYPHAPATNFCTKLASTVSNKHKCPVYCVSWMPHGRRLVTGTQQGEFTLWTSDTFKYDSLLQAHDKAVRSMTWSHNGMFLVSGDEGGFLRVWKPNFLMLKQEKAHAETVQGIAFAPTNIKFATCSDDSTIKIWDLYDLKIESVIRGHAADCKSVDWHPSQGLIASGSKDTLIKIWNPKKGGGGEALFTLHGHRDHVSSVSFNRNGNWLLSASRDQFCKVWDVRMMKELASFKGQAAQVWSAAWHPIFEDLFVSGGQDGSLAYWLVGWPGELQAEVKNAHDKAIWSVAWHPLGHLLATGSGDTKARLWARARPGDIWRDKREIESMDDRDAAPTSTSIPGISSDRPAAIPGIGEAKEQPVMAAWDPVDMGLPQSSPRGSGMMAPPRGPNPPPMPPAFGPRPPVPGWGGLDMGPPQKRPWPAYGPDGDFGPMGPGMPPGRGRGLPGPPGPPGPRPPFGRPPPPHGGPPHDHGFMPPTDMMRGPGGADWGPGVPPWGQPYPAPEQGKRDGRRDGHKGGGRDRKGGHDRDHRGGRGGRGGRRRNRDDRR